MRILVISTFCNMRYEFRYLDPPSDPDQDPDPDQEFWLSIWWGNRGTDFWISFFKKIHIRGVLTFWPWCYFLTLVSRLPAFFWPVLPLGVHRTPAAGELSPAELWWPMQAKSTFQFCSLLSTLHFNFLTYLLRSDFWFYFWAFFVLGLWNTKFAYSAFIHSAATILAKLKS